jgi:hypothetical protein
MMHVNFSLFFIFELSVCVERYAEVIAYAVTFNNDIGGRFDDEFSGKVFVHGVGWKLGVKEVVKSNVRKWDSSRVRQCEMVINAQRYYLRGVEI